MSKDKKTAETPKTFFHYIEKLRWHLTRSIIAVLLFAIAAFIFHDFIFNNIILLPRTPEFFTNVVLCKLGNYVNVQTLCINNQPFDIINLAMAGQFQMHIKISLVAGIIIAFPYIFFELWQFIHLFLKKGENNNTKAFIFICSLLFFCGVLFGYYVIVPLTVHFLGSYSVSDMVENNFSLSSYVSTVTSVVFAAGIVFELPAIIFILSKIGIITSNSLKKYRKHSVLAILALSAIITPPDIFSQVLVTLPLVVLYEVGILIAKRIEKK